MKLWQEKNATIADAAHALGNEPSALPRDNIKRKLIAAVWQGKFEGVMVLHQPRTRQVPKSRQVSISRDELRDAARAFAKLWNGNTHLEVAASEAGMTLGAWLRGQFPEAGRKTLDRMVNGYPAPKAETVTSQSQTSEPEPHIYLLNPPIPSPNDPTGLDTILREGDCVRVPDVPPFVANLSFDALACLPLTAYDGTFKKAYLDCLKIETVAIKRWLTSPRKRTSAPDEKADLIRRYKEVVDNAKNRWSDPRYRPKHYVEMAEKLILIGKACGFNKQVASRILSGKYKPMKNHQLPGIDGLM